MYMVVIRGRYFLEGKYSLLPSYFAALQKSIGGRYFRIDDLLVLMDYLTIVLKY